MKYEQLELDIISQPVGVRFDDSYEIDWGLTYYLAGPMSGYPRYNYDQFDLACMVFRKANMKINSPHEIEYPASQVLGDLPYQVYIDGGLELLDHCQGIILLPGWPQSTGARLELTRALERDLPVLYAQPVESYKGGRTFELISMNRRPPA